jgi:hypothetical protein
MSFVDSMGYKKPGRLPSLTFIFRLIPSYVTVAYPSHWACQLSNPPPVLELSARSGQCAVGDTLLTNSDSLVRLTMIAQNAICLMRVTQFTPDSG